MGEGVCGIKSGNFQREWPPERDGARARAHRRRGSKGARTRTIPGPGGVNRGVRSAPEYRQLKPEIVAIMSEISLHRRRRFAPDLRCGRSPGDSGSGRPLQRQHRQRRGRRSGHIGDAGARGLGDDAGRLRRLGRPGSPPPRGAGQGVGQLSPSGERSVRKAAFGRPFYLRAALGLRLRAIGCGDPQRGAPPGATAATRRWTSAVEKSPVRSMLA